jgi:hypothetical protein
MASDKNQGGLATRFGAWLKSPFSGSMDAFHWFLFFGLIIVIVFLWSRILHYINKGVETI